MERIQRLQRLSRMETMLKRMLAMVLEEKTDAFQAAQQSTAPQPMHMPDTEDDAGTAAPVEYGAEKTAVSILQEQRQQGYVTISVPVYHNENGMWSCVLSVSEIRFECSAVKKKDAHQLCAAAALKHFQLD